MGRLKVKKYFLLITIVVLIFVFIGFRHSFQISESNLTVEWIGLQDTKLSVEKKYANIYIKNHGHSPVENVEVKLGNCSQIIPTIKYVRLGVLDYKFDNDCGIKKGYMVNVTLITSERIYNETKIVS